MQPGQFLLYLLSNLGADLHLWQQFLLVCSAPCFTLNWVPQSKKLAASSKGLLLFGCSCSVRYLLTPHLPLITFTETVLNPLLGFDCSWFMSLLPSPLSLQHYICYLLLPAGLFPVWWSRLTIHWSCVWNDVVFYITLNRYGNLLSVLSEDIWALLFWHSLLPGIHCEIKDSSNCTVPTLYSSCSLEDSTVYSQGYIWCICSQPLRITVQGPFYHPFTHLLRTHLIHVILFYVLTMTWFTISASRLPALLLPTRCCQPASTPAYLCGFAPDSALCAKCSNTCWDALSSGSTPFQYANGWHNGCLMWPQQMAKLREKSTKSIAYAVTKSEKEKKLVGGMDDGNEGHGVSSLTSKDSG